VAQQINLYDPALRPQRDAFTAQSSLLWAVGAALLASALAWGLHWRTPSNLPVLTATSASTAPASAASAAAAPLSAAASELQRLRDFEAHQRRVQAAILDGALGARSGHAEYLRALARQAQPQVWLTGFSIKPETNAIEIDGQALDASALPAYLRRLNSEERFKGRPFAHLHIRQASTEGAAGAQASNGEVAAPSYPQFTLRSQPAGKEAAR
jgi:hypothetical protein